MTDYRNISLSIIEYDIDRSAGTSGNKLSTEKPEYGGESKNT